MVILFIAVVLVFLVLTIRSTATIDKPKEDDAETAGEAITTPAFDKRSKMRCWHCGNIVPATIKCENCGNQLYRTCPICKIMQDPTFKRCLSCNYDFGHAVEPIESNPAVPANPEPVRPTSDSRTATAATDGCSVSYADFLLTHATKSTLGWMKWLPIFGFVSAAGYLLLAAFYLGVENTVVAIYNVVDAACIGVLSFLMWKYRAGWCYASFATYCATIGILGLLATSTGYNLFWVAFAIYTTVKALELEKAYVLYLQNGIRPTDETRS
jgi:hypothetical protein